MHNALVCHILHSALVYNNNALVCCMQSVLDYEFDSDDEWEEEEPGESVSSASEVGNEYFQSRLWESRNCIYC